MYAVVVSARAARVSDMASQGCPSRYRPATWGSQPLGRPNCANRYAARTTPAIGSSYISSGPAPVTKATVGVSEASDGCSRKTLLKARIHRYRRRPLHPLVGLSRCATHGRGARHLHVPRAFKGGQNEGGHRIPIDSHEPDAVFHDRIHEGDRQNV